MQRFISFLFVAVLATHLSMAQFSATGGENGTPFVLTPPTYSGLDKVFVYNGTTNARLSFATSIPTDWTWFRFDKDPSTAVTVASEVSATETYLTNVDSDCGYFVESTGGVRKFVYVVGYKPLEYTGIQFKTDGDVCHSLSLIVLVDAQDMDYYSSKGVKTRVGREHKLSWNSLEWNASTSSYETKERTSKSGDLTFWSVDAPLCDTHFTVSGDQFAEFFGTSILFESALYQAVAVKTSAVATMIERSALNELDRVSTSGDLSGSAPLVIDFKSNSSPAVEFNRWFIYDTPDATDRKSVV